KLHTLYFDSDGFLWSSGFRAGSNAMINVKNGEKKVVKGVDQSEIIYSKGNKLYLGEYPNANLYVYNKKHEWVRTKGHPNVITKIVGLDRIVTAAASCELKEVCFATVPASGNLGGASLIANP